MYVKKTITNNLHISFVLSSRKGRNISYCKSIDVISDLVLINDTKMLMYENKKLFPKHKKIDNANNLLIAIKIEKLKEKAKNDILKISKLYNILRKNLPTIFCKKTIQKNNIINTLTKDFEHIYASAYAILGENEVQDFDLQKKFYIAKNSLSSSFEILDDDEILSDYSTID
ncbi:hypothetical protein COBT_000497 [Conglomerata obtusa]